MSFDSPYTENSNAQTLLFELIKPFVLKNIKFILLFIFIAPVLMFYLLKTYFGLSVSFGPSVSEELYDMPITEPSAPSNTTVLVDVSGAVANPGVYEFTEGGLVGDVLAKAGPILNDASIAWVSFNLNLARPLKNNEKIYIPFEHDISQAGIEVALNVNLETIAATSEESSSSMASADALSTQSPSTNTSSLVNLNTASLDELKALPSIGEVYATKIIESRPYTGVSDFQQKAPISANTFSKIKDLVTF